MLPFDYCKVLGDTQLETREKVCRCQCQKLSLTDTGPEQDIKSNLRIGLVGGRDKQLELVKCPDLHGIRRAFSHAPCTHAGIIRQLIVPDSIIHNGGHFVIDGFQIGGSIAYIRFLLISLLSDPVLPVTDIQFVDLVDRLLGKEGQEHSGEALLLPDNGRDINIPVIAEVHQIIIHQRTKGDVGRMDVPGFEGSFKVQSIFFPGKSPLGFLLVLAKPVPIFEF